MTRSAFTTSTDVFAEQPLASAAENPSFRRGDPALPACFAIYRVEWCETIVCAGRQRLIHHFRAPDAESVCRIFRHNGIACDAVWAGSIHGSLESGRGNLLIDHHFGAEIPADSEEAIRIVAAQRLAPRSLELRCAIVTRDQSRILCICGAADVLNHLKDRVWLCRQSVRSHGAG
jgi:hypothetical protein